MNNLRHHFDHVHWASWLFIMVTCLAWFLTPQTIAQNTNPTTSPTRSTKTASIAILNTDTDTETDTNIDDPNALSIVSFNIRYGTANDRDNHWRHRKQAVLKTIKQLNPDVLGVQECLSFQAKWLQDKMPNYGFYGIGREDGKQKGEMAGLFYNQTRFELIDQQTRWLSQTPTVVASVGWDAALTRIVSWVRLKDKQTGTIWTVANAHLDHRGQKARPESCGLIAQFAQDGTLPTPLVVLGDFNAAAGDTNPQSAYQRLLAAPLIDTFTAVNDPKGATTTTTTTTTGTGTFNGFDPNRRHGARIDWVTVSEEIQTYAAGIDHSMPDGRLPSDHFPVWAIVGLQVDE